MCDNGQQADRCPDGAIAVAQGCSALAALDPMMPRLALLMPHGGATLHADCRFEGISFKLQVYSWGSGNYGRLGLGSGAARSSDPCAGCWLALAWTKMIRLCEKRAHSVQGCHAASAGQRCAKRCSPRTESRCWWFRGFVDGARLRSGGLRLQLVLCWLSASVSCAWYAG